MRERNLEETLKLLGPSMSGFGTALDERGDTVEQSRALYARDIDQAPNPIEYEIVYRNFQLLSPKIGLVRAEMHLTTSILNQEVKLLNNRTTMVFARDDQGRWLVAHLHVSLPTHAHGESEAYPIKELEDRAIVLARLVKLRTKEIQEVNEKLQRLSVTDTLTNIYNRMKADELLDQELSRNRRYNSRMSVILFDIDSFKRINDTLGHRVGDEVLIAVAKVLNEVLRITDVPARWGGDEFLVICPEVGLSEAVELAERLGKYIAALEIGSSVVVSASLGVTEAIAGDSRESIIERADNALYRAKGRGKNCVESL